MQPSKFLQVVLCLAGGIAAVIGALILTSPVAFYATNHIDLGNNASLLSEIRAPAGALFAYGLLIVTGAFVPQLTFTATLLATLLYLSYGFSRLVGMAIDGTQPSQGPLLVESASSF
ncbi:MAG: DUF4345 domain-containing protein [Cyanobacteria bacterium]|nr:DUF4345 domain-containing protein [Cyanobacteriota bacterium]MDA0866677.1 DUF4345 domain-containing protein [Cyanobacteriota bacterium]